MRTSSLVTLFTQNTKTFQESMTQHGNHTSGSIIVMNLRTGKTEFLFSIKRFCLAFPVEIISKCQMKSKNYTHSRTPIVDQRETSLQKGSILLPQILITRCILESVISTNQITGLSASQMRRLRLQLRRPPLEYSLRSTTLIPQSLIKIP